MNNYTLKLYKNNGEVETVRTKKKKRFFRILRMIDWQNHIKNAYLKISYGKKKCTEGCLCDFYNDGYYANKEDMLETFKYFNEEK